MDDAHEQWLREALARYGLKASAPVVEPNGTVEHNARQAAKAAAEAAEVERLESFKRLYPGNQLPMGIIFGRGTE